MPRDFQDHAHGSWLSISRCPAMAQSILPVFLSIRRSRYQSFTDMTMVSVVSCAGSGSHRIEIRVEKRQDVLGGSGLAMVVVVGGGFDLEVVGVDWRVY